MLRKWDMTNEEENRREKAMAEESQRKAEKQADKERIEGNFNKSVSYTSKIMDKYYIDPILGVICPELGMESLRLLLLQLLT